MENLYLRKFTGKISPATRGHLLRKLITWLDAIAIYNAEVTYPAALADHRPIFITLTLPCAQQHSDKEFKRKIFDNFLQWLQRETGSNLYFWRAEKQENGNIHFHIVHDTYIDKIKLQTFWNHLLQQHGYNAIDKKKYTTGLAPSTHVRVIDNSEAIPGYILKYSLKKTKGKAVEGRVWGMSDKLREIDSFEGVLDNNLEDELLSAEKSKAITITPGDYFTLIAIINPFLARKIMKTMYSSKDKHAINTYNFLYHDQWNPSTTKVLKDEHIPYIKEYQRPKNIQKNISGPGWSGISASSAVNL